MVPKKNLPTAPIPLYKRLWRLVIKILRYPHRIAKKYAKYNSSIGEMIYALGDRHLDDLRRKNAKLVNALIYLPMVLGLIGSIVSIYLHFHHFESYFEVAFRPIIARGLFSEIGAYLKRAYFIVTALPLRGWDWQALGVGYLASILGAWFMSLNPAFKEEERIRHIFATLSNIDSEGNPWKITWTPNAIMIESFNADPYALCSKNAFWSSINFPPSQPKVFPENMNKFIVQRRFELPSELKYEF